MDLTVKSFSEKLYEKAKEKGADPALLVKDNTEALLDLSVNAVSALNGDERVKAHLEAQFKLGKFSAKAGAFLEAKIWWEALGEVLQDVATAGIGVLAEAVAKGLVGAMKEGGL